MRKDVAKAIVLGSAAGGGFPQWNCQCRVCALAWAGDPRVERRTQSSLALTGGAGSLLIVNASPDVAQQIHANSSLWPAGSSRGSPITDVLLTSAEIDHCAGLLALRERHRFRLLATEAVHAALDQNPMFEALDRSLVERDIVDAEAPFEASDLRLRLFAVPGKPPLYTEESDPEIGTETGDVSGLWVEGGATRLAYVPGCAFLTETLRERLAEADIILFDGTLFTDGEMIGAGLGTKTGRRMGHVPIGGDGGSLDALRELPARRKIYVHINNTNPILIEGSPERLVVEAAGFEVARDGLEIAL